MSKKVDLYSLDDLINIFEDHKKRYENSDFYDKGFNLPKALLTLCIEISKLKQ